jgi:RNA polymerase sigma-70 factor, ECF subfamily
LSLFGFTGMVDDRQGQTDEALMAQAAEGHSEAFETLMTRYERPLVTFCYSFLRDQEAAEDLTQETFLRVYRNAARFRPMAKFTTWLYRIALNLCINESKKRKLRYTVPLDGPAGLDPDGTRIVERIASNAAMPLNEAERHEANMLVRRALGYLPEEQRLTLVMVEYHGMSYGEIAEIMEVTVSAIKMRVKRSRYTLREMLKMLAVE